MLKSYSYRWKIEGGPESQSPASKRKRYGTDPIIVRNRLEDIERKIHEKESIMSSPDSFSNAKPMNR